MGKYHRSSKFQRATTFRDLNDPKPVFGGIEVRKTPIFESRGHRFFLVENGILHKVNRLTNNGDIWKLTLTVDGKMVIRELKGYEMIYTCEKDVSGHKLDNCNAGDFDRVANDTHQGDAGSRAA